MSNFLVQLSGGNEKVHNEVTKIFSKQFLEQNLDLNNKKDKYILTEKYVETFLIPYLYKQNSYNDFYAVKCEFDIPTENLNNQNLTNEYTSPNKININLYGSQIYFENIENESEYKSSETNCKTFPIKEYNIKNKNVLLLHGFFNYRDCGQTEKFEKGDNNCIKGLYNYIKNSVNTKTNIKDCLKNIEGSFVLIYIEYEKGNQINMYFFNDQFGMKSFIYFYEQTSLILTNMYAPFIHYNFNYTNINTNEYIFNDSSINDHVNLLQTDNPITCNDKKESLDLCKTYDNKDIAINDKIGINITPYDIYKISFRKQCEVLFEKIKKDNCIYTEDYQWKDEQISLKKNFENIINFFKKNSFLFSNIDHELEISQLNNITQMLCDQIKNNPQNEESFQNILTEIKLNNIFVNLYLKLLSSIVRRKIQIFFNSSISQKFENKNKPCTCRNDVEPRFPNKSISILFSGSVDSMLLSIITIHNFFSIYKNGYIELINVCFDENAIDRYTCLISYEQINKMFPTLDIRLLLIDVQPHDLIKYEKIIYYIMAPNHSIMDYNISSALFFSNIKNGYILSPNFFSTPDWESIKKKVSPVLNISTEKDDLQNIKTHKENCDTTNLNSDVVNNKTSNKCSVCEFRMNPNCIHKSCAVCCRKLRYIYYKEYLSKKNENDKETNKIDITNSAENLSKSNHDIQNRSGMYQMHTDPKTGEDIIYLLVKKKKVLINFDIYYNCTAHKEKLYNYHEIDSLFINFAKELKETHLENAHENDSEKMEYPNPDIRQNTDFINNFIQKEKANLNLNNKNSEEQIRNLLCRKSKTEKKNDDKIYLNDMKDEEEESLNYLSKELYRKCNGLALSKSEEHEKEETKCCCKRRMLIIGSGADELYGGYYRQNAKLKKNNHKLNEMIKDIKRLWIRNLYRDDRIITYANDCEQYVFYPYLDIHLINFLFSIPFQNVEKPISITNLCEHKNNSLIFSENEKLIYNDKNKIEIKFDYLINNLDEHYKLYTSINNYKISKWILRMSIYFLKCKDVIFFKKKAIQFGSKAKHISKYMEEYILLSIHKNPSLLNIYDQNKEVQHDREKKKKKKKKGDTQYTLVCIGNIPISNK
ncbi:conserved Plasmodium protein, unknown function [Plasmodium chabaudi chabaudi]|uniref:Asparagine synthase n=1 Tax=Plasmodium chabaudi chabaudi TaxID=31271 RepID=A0A4V0KC16_PLACU|nr:conserved Plasmodium protein, unknown function [Plasmodium chabaudi chabaudi]VTZ70390.1 conserved Plasmodium protein, unknown function [Plasmodium chabaudi chabaudi]|eukprot:XP_742367.2 conserved Plasmodium protein, unknown function [Plasmodium chabaudi chabaudi]